MYAGGGFFGDALYFRGDLCPLVGRIFYAGSESGHYDLELMVVVFLTGQRWVCFDFFALNYEHCRVAAVIYDEVRSGTVGPGKGLFGTPPVLFECFAFPCEYGCATSFCDGCGCVVLS